MAEFHDPSPPDDLGDPALDAPMTVRIEPGRRWSDPSARRAVRTDGRSPLPAAWVLVTGGDPSMNCWPYLKHDEVRSWPVTHAIEYAAAFRHASGRTEIEQATSAGRGDMDVEAFKG